MKRAIVVNRRRHGLRSGLALAERAEKTVVTFERRAQVYCWSTDRVRARPVIKH